MSNRLVMTTPVPIRAAPGRALQSPFTTSGEDKFPAATFGDDQAPAMLNASNPQKPPTTNQIAYESAALANLSGRTSKKAQANVPATSAATKQARTTSTVFRMRPS